jgi:diguanylate cyclase (GGDEF)-like protein/PAS domain S-box-containing protein
VQDETRRANGLLPGAEERLRCLTEWGTDGYLVYDGSGRVLDANPAACAAHGFPAGELIGTAVDDLFAAPGLSTSAERLGSGDPRTLEARGRRRDGSTFPAQVTLGMVQDGGPPAFMALVHDLSEESDSRERIAYLSEHDALTGLPNQQRFAEHLEHAIERAERGRGHLAVLHVDLNRFALINQGLGFAGGDELLRQTASRLRESVRPMDLVARLSADEFLVLAAELGPEDPAHTGTVAEVTAIQAEQIADAVHASLQRPYEIEGREVYASAAVGVSLYPLDADSSSVMLRHACSAAQQAKRPGEAPTTFYGGETTDKWARLSLAARLHKAVKNGRLVLHYQPVVDLQEGRTVAVEALARWPDRDGLVPAARFIPVAEDMGLIDAIGEWVMEEVCAQLGRWAGEGLDIAVAFNLSLREMWNPNLVERLGRQLREAGVDPERLIVEITESSAMTDAVRSHRVLSGIQDLGVTLALDDFGTGHSSLGRLADMPCEILKIDRSFIARVPEDASAAAMVTAIVDLARRLGKRAVAEGVEKESQLAFLREVGCPLAQGYLFGPPAPAQEAVPR